VTVAKAYRLLHAIFTTAADQDRIVRRNPCSIDGSGKEDSHEREIVPLPVVFTIASKVPVRYRPLVLLATFADLRWGELAGLRRENIDLAACEVRVVETLAEPDQGSLRPETPKSRAGRRTVAFPAELVPELRWHLEQFAEPGERGYVFVGPKGGRLRRSNFRPIWYSARMAVNLPDLHFHDLRHTGGTLSEGHEPEGADGAAGSLQRPRCDDVPARDQGPGSGHRPGPRGPHLSPDNRCGTYVARARGRAPVPVGQQGSGAAADPQREHESGRRESNPHSQLGRLELYH
jgi:hypothetical protein